MKKSFYLQSLLVFCMILLSSVSRAAVPVVTTDPSSKTACDGTKTFFKVAASGSPTFKWDISTDGGFTWSQLKDTLEFSGTTTDSIIISADMSLNGTMFRARANNTDGADTSLAATLTVMKPDAGIITGATEICKTSTTTLNSTVSGGVWSSVTSSIATVGSSSGLVTGVSFGWDTIKYTATNLCGPATANFVIRVDTNVGAEPITGPNATCVGGFITLNNKNVVGSGIWSSSNPGIATVSSSGVVIGVAYGTSVINYAFTNACSSVSSYFVVNVDTVLNPGTISGSSTVCFGSWVSLSASKPGGMWLSAATSIATVDPSGFVTGIAQGTATISYYFTNACGISAAIHTVTVTRTAANISGIDSVGIGLMRTLTDSTLGGHWFSSDTSIAIIDTFTGVATGKDTGVTTISYVVTNTCGTSTKTMVLNVGPAPYAGLIYGGSGFDSAVCIGSTVTVYDSAKYGVGQWSSKYDTVATIDPSTGVITGVGYGLDTIYYTFTNSFGTSKTSIPFFVNHVPVIDLLGPAMVSLGGNYFFSGKPYYEWTHTPSSQVFPNASTITNVGAWADSNTAMGAIVSTGDSIGIHVANIASYVVLHFGVTKLTYSLTNTCGTAHKSWRVSLPGGSGVKLTVDKSSAMAVYPNPTTGAVTIKLSSDVEEDADIVITNVVGATVHQSKITTNKEYTVKIDQPAGLYFIAATTKAGERYETKVVVGK